MWKFLIKVGFAALLFTAAAGANAQSTVWNTPSTDALDEGATLVEVDFLTHFGPTERGGRGLHRARRCPLRRGEGCIGYGRG